MTGLNELKSKKSLKVLFVTNFTRYCVKSGHFDTRLNHRNPASNGGVLSFLELAMNFNELSSESRSQALITLGQLISARGELGEADCETLGRCVAAAFIAMEYHGSDPDKCDDGTQP